MGDLTKPLDYPKMQNKLRPGLHQYTAGNMHYPSELSFVPA